MILTASPPRRTRSSPRISGNACARRRRNKSPSTNHQGDAHETRLTISSARGQPVIIEESTDFRDWAAIGMITNTPGDVDFIHQPAGGRSFFYRLRLPPE